MVTYFILAWHKKRKVNKNNRRDIGSQAGVLLQFLLCVLFFLLGLQSLPHSNVWTSKLWGGTSQTLAHTEERPTPGLTKIMVAFKKLDFSVHENISCISKTTFLLCKVIWVYLFYQSTCVIKRPLSIIPVFSAKDFLAGVLKELLEVFCSRCTRTHLHHKVKVIRESLLISEQWKLV